MANAFSTSGQNRQFSGTTNAVTSLTVPAGALIIASIYWGDQTTTLTSISDGTHSFTLVDNPTNANIGRVAGGYLENSSGGTLTITATMNAGPFSILVVHVVTGTATSSSLDAHLCGLAITGGGTDSTSQSITTTQVGDYLFGVDFDESQNGAVTAGTGFNQRQQFAGNNGVSEDIVSYGSVGSKALTFTTAAFDNHALCTMAFKTASSGTLKTAMGLATASIKTFDGLAKASVKTVDGLTP